MFKMEEIKWFCGIKREEFDEKYKEELRQLNDWYSREMGEAYTKHYIKGYDMYEKNKKKIDFDTFILKIFEGYTKKLDVIDNEYIAQEDRLYQKYLLRKVEETQKFI